MEFLNLPYILIAGLHEGGVAAVSGAGGVFTRAAPFSVHRLCRSKGCQLPPIQQHSAAMSQCCMHYLSKRGDQSERRFYLLQLDFCFWLLRQRRTW